MNEIQVFNEDMRVPLSAEKVRDHVNAVQKVMQAVMRQDTHYGVIPGTKKPTLYKSGAETLCLTFHIATSFKIEDLSTPDEIRYRLTAIGQHQATGVVLGTGLGECSSNEEKYKWRRAVCDEEYEETQQSKRRIKFSKYQGKVEKVMQVKTEPADIANTVLKMAAKRAQVAMTLNVVAASDCFTQDIEDLPEHLRDAAGDEDARNRDAGGVDLTGTKNRKVTLKEVLAAIQTIDSQASYLQVKGMVIGLDNEGDKAKAIEAFKVKAAELKRAIRPTTEDEPPPPPPEATQGDEPPAQGDEPPAPPPDDEPPARTEPGDDGEAPGPSLADVRKYIDRGDMDMAADLVNGLQGAEHTEALALVLGAQKARTAAAEKRSRRPAMSLGD